MPDPATRASRVIFLNRFYWPEEPATSQLLTDLAEGLASQGHEVVVIARHSGGSAIPRTEIHHGVRIERVRSTHWAKAGLVGKAMDFATFFFGGTIRALRVTRAGDALVPLTDPPLIGIGAWLVARFRRARLFHWVQDIYPELAIELAGQHWLRLVRPLRNAAWRGAEHCVTLGRDMSGVLDVAGVGSGRISVVPNWPPAGLAPLAASVPNGLRSDWNLAGKFVVAYSGNFGRVHDMTSSLVVASLLRDDPDIVVALIGDGAKRRVLERTCQRFALNVIFRPPQPRTRLSETLSLGDVQLVTVRAGCERYVFPSKLYGIAAVGRPVIFIGPRDCEIARIIEENGFGFAFAPDQLKDLATKLAALKNDPETRVRLGNAALAWTMKTGGLTSAVDRWHALLGAPTGLATISPRA